MLAMSAPTSIRTPLWRIKNENSLSPIEIDYFLIMELPVPKDFTRYDFNQLLEGKRKLFERISNEQDGQSLYYLSKGNSDDLMALLEEYQKYLFFLDYKQLYVGLVHGKYGEYITPYTITHSMYQSLIWYYLTHPDFARQCAFNGFTILAYLACRFPSVRTSTATDLTIKAALNIDLDSDFID